MPIATPRRWIALFVLGCVLTTAGPAHADPPRAVRGASAARARAPRPTRPAVIRSARPAATKTAIGRLRTSSRAVRAPRPAPSSRVVAPRVARRNPLLARSWRRLRSVDALIEGIHASADGTRVQLTGSSLYETVGGLERGTSPTFRDIDLRVGGASVDAVLSQVQRAYPDVDLARDVVIEPGYEPGVSHVQVAVGSPRGPPTQLDLSIYPDAAALDAPHQWVTTAKLKLEVGRGERLSSLLHTASHFEGARGMRQLRDPSGTGVRDLANGVLRVHVEPTARRGRAVEGLLHTLYLAGRDRSLRVHPSTLRRMNTTSTRTLRRFFDPRRAGRSFAAVRARYVLGVVRRTGRNLRRGLSLARSTGLLARMFPSLARVTSDPATFDRTLALVESAVPDAQLDDRLARARRLGALFAGADPAAVQRDLARFEWGATDAEATSIRDAIWTSYRAASSRLGGMQ